MAAEARRCFGGERSCDAHAHATAASKPVHPGILLSILYCTLADFALPFVLALVAVAWRWSVRERTCTTTRVELDHGPVRSATPAPRAPRAGPGARLGLRPCSLLVCGGCVVVVVVGSRPAGHAPRKITTVSTGEKAAAIVRCESGGGDEARREVRREDRQRPIPLEGALAYPRHRN